MVLEVWHLGAQMHNSHLIVRMPVLLEVGEEEVKFESRAQRLECCVVLVAVVCAGCVNAVVDRVVERAVVVGRGLAKLGLAEVLLEPLQYVEETYQDTRLREVFTAHSNLLQVFVNDDDAQERVAVCVTC